MLSKKNYQEISVEVIEFESEDVVRCSNGEWIGEDIYNDPSWWE